MTKSKDLPKGAVGVGLVDSTGRLAFSLGVVEQAQIRAMLTDKDWLTEASRRRIVVINLTTARYVATVTDVDEAHLIVFFNEAGATTTQFLMGVDFAYDIIEHLLTDPYDAMAIIDANARLAFVSPIHEKFFGLKSGEAVGEKVRDVIQNTRLHHVVRTGVAEIGQIQKMNGRERVVSRHPIRREGKVVGAIGRVMFKGPQQVEAMARRINALEEEIKTYRAEATKNSEGEAFLTAIVGRSAAVQELRAQIRKISPLDIPVLIQGESGTGKELVAQALHMASPRRAERLVTVNAAALPAPLVESELFGYEAGAFTGADKKGRVGKFEQADRGTIFLDEIGDMPLDVQSKLLRVLQDRVVEKVGGDKPRKVDFRLVSATNRELEELVAQGKFRLDLYYRISPVIIQMPSLAERLEDIPDLLQHFLGELSQRYDRPVPEIDSDVFMYLGERDWPGNIRELRHLTERAFVFCEDNRLKLADFRNGKPAPVIPSPMSIKGHDFAEQGSNLRDALERYERELVAEAMNRFDGNKKRVAEHLGVSRSYLYKKFME